MLLSVKKTNVALTEAVVGRYLPAGHSEERIAAVSGFLMNVQSNMPDFLRLPFRILILGFDAWPYPSTGKPFHKLDPIQRRVHVESWEHSRLDFRRGFIAFYQSLATFGIYSELYGNDSEIVNPHE